MYIVPPFGLRARLLAVLGAASAAALVASYASAEPIPVLHPQGSMHAFVALMTLDGKRIAIGDVTGVVHGSRITSRLLFHFRDGSIDDDTTVFTQHGTFRLISDHHVQHGPSFPKPIDVTIDAVSGQVTSHSADGKVTREHMDLPADLANGLPPNLLMNVAPSTPETRLSFLAPGDKLRLVHVIVKPSGPVTYTIGGLRRQATDYVLHVELGGLTGVIAPLIGKQPNDYHIWIASGPTPMFIREEGQLYQGGPVWRIEQISPAFPR